MKRLRDVIGAWRLQLEIAVDRWSIWPFAVLSLLVAGAVAGAIAFERLGNEVSAGRAALGQHKRIAEARAEATPAPANDDAAPPLLAVLPAATRRAEDLKTLFRLARAQGLLVAQADYAAPGDAQSSLEGVQLSLPLTGTYPQLRRFAEAALRALPHLSLDQIGFEREGTVQPSITARIRLTLWYRPEPSERPATVAASSAKEPT